MLTTAKYVIVNGCAIIFSAAIKHSTMVENGKKATSAGFVQFVPEINEFGEYRLKANVFGESVSLNEYSKDEDIIIINEQILNTY